MQLVVMLVGCFLTGPLLARVAYFVQPVKLMSVCVRRLLRSVVVSSLLMPTARWVWVAGWGVGLCVLVCVTACTPPILARVCGVGVCAWAQVSAVHGHSWLGCWVVCFRVYDSPVPRPTWLGCAVWEYVLGLGFQLLPAIPGSAVGVCVCLFMRSACNLPIVAGVFVFGVFAWARASAAPSHSWLGCWGFCVGVRLLPVPRHSWLVFVVCGLRVAWHQFLCNGSLWVVRAVQVCGTRWPLLLGTCPSVSVVAGGVSLPGVPLGTSLVCRASSGLVALGAPAGFRDAVLPVSTQGACTPTFPGRLHGVPGSRPRTGLFVPAAGRCRGSSAGLTPRRTSSGPRDGVVPGRVLLRRSWAACAAVSCVCGAGH